MWYWMDSDQGDNQCTLIVIAKIQRTKIKCIRPESWQYQFTTSFMSKVQPVKLSLPETEESCEFETVALKGDVIFCCPK